MHTQCARRRKWPGPAARHRAGVLAASHPARCHPLPRRQTTHDTQATRDTQHPDDTQHPGAPHPLHPMHNACNSTSQVKWQPAHTQRRRSANRVPSPRKSRLYTTQTTPPPHTQPATCSTPPPWTRSLRVPTLSRPPAFLPHIGRPTHAADPLRPTTHDGAPPHGPAPPPFPPPHHQSHGRCPGPAPAPHHSSKASSRVPCDH
jgi:hypothetical protein